MVPFPFSAIVGQEAMKLALLVCAVDERVGGVLIRGHRGTAKSTAARALAALMPQVDVVAGCPFSCDPGSPEELCDGCAARGARGEPLEVARRPVRLVDLPIGTSEDRLLGALDLEAALAHGERRFEPGVLAAAHRGILCIDEVNLLGDHLVDLMLDAAAMGVSRVEREGTSFRHFCRFVLVGTMNPEEGEPRPQLLDRFGLCVGVRGSTEPEERARWAGGAWPSTPIRSPSGASGRSARRSSGGRWPQPGPGSRASRSRRRRLFRTGPGAAATAGAFEGRSLADLAVRATIREALLRAGPPPEGARLAPAASDLRKRIVERRPRSAVAFVVDASSSMRRDSRLGRVEALLGEYVHECHVRRDRVALVVFRHDRSRLACPFTANAERATRAVADVEMGGRTPLAEGMVLGLRALRAERARSPELAPVLVVLSDGRPNLSLEGSHPYDEAVAVARRAAASGVALVFVDTEDDPMSSGCGHAVATAARGAYELLPRLVRRRRPAR